MFNALTSRFSSGESTVEQEREVEYERRVVDGREVDLRVEAVYGEEVEESDSKLIDLWLDHFSDDELFWTIVSTNSGGLGSSMDFGSARVCIEARRVE